MSERSSSILTRNSRADWAPICGRALAPISTTRPAKRWPVRASSVTLAGCPTASRITSASATLTSALIVLRSEIVIRIVPGWFCTPITTISPSSTSSLVIVPLIGAVMVVFDN